MRDSDDITFHQAPALSGATLVLLRDRVVVRENAAGEQLERHIRIEDISADIELSERRFTRFFVVLIVFAIVFAAAAWKVAGPSLMSFSLAVLFSSVAASCILAGFVTRDSIEVAKVKSKDGEVLFELYRHRSVAASYAEFLLALRRKLSTQ